MAYVYTQKEFEEISQLYQSGQSLDHIQSLFPDKSVASIRMKLVKAGLYTKPAATVKATDKKPASPKPAPKPTTKAGIRAAFKTALGYVGDATF